MKPLVLKQACLGFLRSMLFLLVWCALGYHQPSAGPRLQIREHATESCWPGSRPTCYQLRALTMC